MQIPQESGWVGHETSYILCDSCSKAISS